MRKLEEELTMRSQWLRLARHKLKLEGEKVAGHWNISSTMKNSVQLRMTLGMWQKRKTMTMQMRTVAKLTSLPPFLFAFMWVNLSKSFTLIKT